MKLWIPSPRRRRNSASDLGDAYFLDCAIRHNAPLLTLDQKLKRAAKNLNVTTWEV